jgi:hypothetical protein
MKIGDKVKYVGESIYGIKNQIGKIVKEMPSFGPLSPKKLWEVAFGGHIGTHICLETDLKVIDSQLQFPFMYV